MIKLYYLQKNYFKKSKKEYFLTFYLPLIGLLLFGCRPQETYPNFDIGSEFKNYTVFKTGTWWNYQDSATTKTNKFWVTGFSNTYDSQKTPKFIKRFEKVSYQIYSTDSLFISYSIKTEDSDYPEKFYMNYNSTDSDKNEIEVTCLASNKDFTWDGSPHLKNIIHSELMGYKDVVETTIGYNQQHSRFTKIWYAKNIGPIKYKFKNGQTLILKNYHIVQ